MGSFHLILKVPSCIIGKREKGVQIDRYTYIHIELEREREKEWLREPKKEFKATMVSYMSLLVYGVGGIVVAGMALLVAFQEKLVYVPVLPGLTKSYPITPARLRLLYEDVWLRSSDGVRLHAWFIKLLPDCRGFPLSVYIWFSLLLNPAVLKIWWIKLIILDFVRNLGLYVSFYYIVEEYTGLLRSSWPNFSQAMRSFVDFHFYLDPAEEFMSWNSGTY